RRRHTRFSRDWSSDVCSSDLLRLARERARDAMRPVATPTLRLTQDDVFAARAAVLDLHVAPAVERYLVELVLASRDAARYDAARSEERRVGKEWRSRRARDGL